MKQALTEHLWDKFVRSERQVFGLYRINLRKRFPTLGLYFKFGFPVYSGFNVDRFHSTFIFTLLINKIIKYIQNEIVL